MFKKKRPFLFSLFLALLKSVFNSCYAFGCQRKSFRDWLKENFETWHRSVLTIVSELWHFLWTTNFQTFFREPFSASFCCFFFALLKRVFNSCYAFGCQRKSFRDLLNKNFETWPRSVLTILSELWHFLWNTNFQTSNSQPGFHTRKK